MEVATTQNINFIRFSELYNWSVSHLLGQDFEYNKNFPLVKIGKFLTKNNNVINLDNDTIYKRVTVSGNNGGVRLRNTEVGKNIGTKRQFIVKSGQFILSKIDARNGAMGLVPEDLEGAIVTNDFPTYNVDTTAILPQFLLLITTTKKFIEFAQTCSSGTTNRQRIDLKKFLDVQIPLPPLDDADALKKGLSTDITQEKLVAEYNQKIKKSEQAKQNAIDKEAEIQSYLYKELGIQKAEKKEATKGLFFVQFKSLKRWDFWNEYSKITSSLYPLIEFEKTTDLIKSKVVKLKTNQFKQSGKTPIISQEADFISGYTDLDIQPILKEDLPLIIFGDHSQTKKFVDFQFIVGADGVKLIKPNENFNPKFYFYFLETLNFNVSQKYTRHYKYLKNEMIPQPPLKIQKVIADKISTQKKEINLIKLKAKNLLNKSVEDFENAIFKQ